MSTDDTQKWIDTWNHREREKQLDLLGPSVCNPAESWYFALHMFENRCDDFWFQMCHLMQKKRRLKEQKKKKQRKGRGGETRIRADTILGNKASTRYNTRVLETTGIIMLNI